MSAPAGNTLANLKRNVDDWYNKKFDDQQRLAVDGIVDRWAALNDTFILPIVDGPPGTGKTTVGAVACAKYLLSGAGSEVVYMCHTNVACQRAHQTLQSLGFVCCPPGTQQAQAPVYAVRVIAQRVARNWTGCVVGMPSDRPLSDMDMRYLKIHNVILCTLDSASKVRDLRDNPKVVVDEFSQANPPAFFAAVERICRDKKATDGFALLGDPIQLPVVTTQPALRPNIATFILARKPYPTHTLEVQHRMHEHICEAVNMIRTKVYHTHPLISAAHVKYRTMVDPDLNYAWDPSRTTGALRRIIDPRRPLVLVNTDALGPEERGFGESWKNPKEAELAVALAGEVHKCFTGGDEVNKVRVLTPYVAQNELIGEGLENALGAPAADWGMTIHRAQGQEFACVIISFVRNNNTGRVGFLEEDDLRAQTYVAISRAQAKLIVLMSNKTFLGHGHADFEALFDAPHAHKEVVS